MPRKPENSARAGDVEKPAKPSAVADEYAQLAQKAEEQQPGINELLELYGQFQQAFNQSQEYLQLVHETFISSNSSTSSPQTH
jgi:hypothetical protein